MKNKKWKFNWWNLVSLLLSTTAVIISVRSCDETKRANTISEAGLKIQQSQHRTLIKPELDVSIQASKFGWTNSNGSQYFPKDSSYFYVIKNVGRGKATLLSFQIEDDSSLNISFERPFPVNIQSNDRLLAGISLRKYCNENCEAKIREALESNIKATYSDEIGTTYYLYFTAVISAYGDGTRKLNFNKRERELSDTLDIYAKWY